MTFHHEMADTKESYTSGGPPGTTTVNICAPSHNVMRRLIVNIIVFFPAVSTIQNYASVRVGKKAQVLPSCVVRSEAMLVSQ